MYDASFKEDAPPLFDPLLPTLEEEKKLDEEEKELGPVIEYYPPSPIYTPRYKEDASAIVNNLGPKSAPVAKENEQTNIKDKPEGEDTKGDKGEDTKEDKGEDKYDRTQMGKDTGEDIDDDDSNLDYIY